MKWRYLREGKQLLITDPELDVATLRSLIRHRMSDRNIEAVVFTTSAFTLIMRGPFLERWIAARHALEARDEP